MIEAATGTKIAEIHPESECEESFDICIAVRPEQPYEFEFKGKRDTRISIGDDVTISINGVRQ